MRLSTIENKLNGLKGSSVEFRVFGFQGKEFGGASRYCATSGEFPIVSQVDLASLSDFISEKAKLYFQPQIGYIFLKKPFLGSCVSLDPEIRGVDFPREDNIDLYKLEREELPEQESIAKSLKENGIDDRTANLVAVRWLADQRFFKMFPAYLNHGKINLLELPLNILPKDIPWAYSLEERNGNYLAIVENYIGQITSDRKIIERGIRVKVGTRNLDGKSLVEDISQKILDNYYSDKYSFEQNETQ